MRTKYSHLLQHELRRELEHQIQQGAVDMELCKEIALRAVDMELCKEIALRLP